MGRSPCCSKEGLNRGAWTAHEDKVLTEYIRVHGEGKWRNLPKRAGLKRCGKSCRLRWLNYLRPDIKRGNISSDEEELIIRLHKLLGNRWSLIAGRLPGRTDNEIKNYWNTNLGKKVKDQLPQQQTNTCSHRRVSSVEPNNNNGKSTQIQKPHQQFNNNPMAPPFPTFTPPKPNSHVVRTKATKCSKVVFINSLLHSSSPSPSPPMAMQLQNKPGAETEPLLVDHAVASTDSMMEPSNNIGFLSFPNEEKELLSTDLLVDFNVGDICLSDLLNSDFSNMENDLSYIDTELLSSPACCNSDQQPPMFSDEILNDWTQTNFAADETNNNVSDNLQYSLTTFPDSSEKIQLGE